MKHALLRIAAIALLPLGLASCLAPAPYVDRDLGKSMTDMRHAQYINPGADRNMTVPNGLDATAAKSGYDQYEKSFKAPEKNSTSFTIGVGK
jgi:hypothetical protein